MKLVRVRIGDAMKTERIIGKAIRAYLARMVARARLEILSARPLGKPIRASEAIEIPADETVVRRAGRVSERLRISDPRAWTNSAVPNFAYYRDRLIDRADEERMVKVLTGVKTGAYISSATQAALDLGRPPVISDEVLRAIQQKAFKIVTTEITPTLRDQLVDRLEANIRAGFSIDETAHSFGMLETNWRTIAKTETHDVYEQGSWDQVKNEAEEFGAEVTKYWQHSGNEHAPRETHLAAAEQYGPDDAIPIDEPFIVGGETMMRPHDPDASAENVINCGCTAIYLVGGKR
ncbi:MAG: hypothetical protein A4E67_00199 [Syntrophaceae bacterium PtaB.Bin038]|nr:MAG: hypothetical protein A4E67_00199 [Syntrophaceae bacterium PtaB.Bin038]